MCPVDRNIPKLLVPPSKGQVVTGTFLKISTGKSGISVARRTRDGAIVIGRIEPGSMASTTPLKPGMRFLSINNKPITHLMTCREVADLLINGSGKMTVVAASGVAGAFFKPSPGEKTGVTVGKMSSGKVFISKIAPSSLVATDSPHLREGMPITAINNIPVEGMSCQEAADLLIRSSGVVTITA